MKKKNLSERSRLSKRSNVFKIGNVTPSKKLIFIMVGVLFIFYFYWIFSLFYEQ